MASSPTRTFSPSERCLEDGCTVHQHASPSDSSCRPTSKASLSQLELLDRHARYCNWRRSNQQRRFAVLYINCLWDGRVGNDCFPPSPYLAHHVAVGVAQKDGVSVEQGLVARAEAAALLRPGGHELLQRPD